MTFYKDGQSKDEVGPPKDGSATKKRNVVILEVKFEPDVNGVGGEIAGCENGDHGLCPRETLEVHTGRRTLGKGTDHPRTCDGQSGCDEKDEVSGGGDTGKTFTF